MNENGLVRGPGFHRSSFPPDVAFDAPATNVKRGLACRSGVADRLGWSAACHAMGRRGPIEL
jgi:hypothetical protein